MDTKKQISLFKTMLYIRMVEERIIDLYPDQEIRCPVHLSIGQEAVAAGVCMNLSQKDAVFSNHRGHSHYLAKGGDLNKFFAEIYGKVTGCSEGRGGSMHLIDLPQGFIASTPIVAGTIPVSVGAALYQKLMSKQDIVVVFFGDGALEEGVVHECMNFAKLHNLPILFVCENNKYAVYTPLNQRQPDRPLTNLAKAHDIEIHQANGNNVLEVYDISKTAIDKIKSGSGPVFIEFSTYRWREHCGVNYDNNIGYRCEEEFQEWKNQCPIESMKRLMISEDTLTEEKIVEIQSEINNQIDDAIKFAKQSPSPTKEDLKKHIYN
jgi:TPP-dependent pyruvate/acetoin dehydrogenase alpha subunit